MVVFASVLMWLNKRFKNKLLVSVCVNVWLDIWCDSVHDAKFSWSYHRLLFVCCVCWCVVPYFDMFELNRSQSFYESMPREFRSRCRRWLLVITALLFLLPMHCLLFDKKFLLSTNISVPWYSFSRCYYFVLLELHFC